MPTFQVRQWAAVNQTSSGLVLERMSFIGCPLASLAYGVHLVVFFACFRALLQRRRTQRHLIVYGQLAYISVLFIFGTIENVWNIQSNVLAFVDNRNTSGGTVPYSLKRSNLRPLSSVAMCIYIASTWMQEGLLLLRFFIIYDSNWWLLVIPALGYAISTILSCILLANILRPGDPFFHSSFHFALASSGSSIALTIVLTLLIVGRLMHMRHRLHKVFPDNQSPYLTISAMLAESAALYSILSFVWIILYLKNHPAQYVILPPLPQIQMIASELTILRVAQGHAVSKGTFTKALQDSNARHTITDIVFLPQISRSASTDSRPPDGLNLVAGTKATDVSD